MNTNHLDEWKENTDFNDNIDLSSLINKSMKKAKHDQLIHKIKICSFTFLIPFAIFITLINTSQKFVSAIDDVWLLGDLVNMFKYNPSIYYARNSDYFQKIDRTFETKDYTLYVESMVVDEDSAVLFYKLTANNRLLNAIDQDWTFVNYENYAGIIPIEAENPNELSYVQFDPIDTIQSGELKFRFLLKNMDKSFVSEKTEFTVKCDPSKLGKAITYNFNQVVEFDEQKITIEKIEIYPLRTRLFVSQDVNNTYEILNFDFSLYDQNGKKCEGIHNGITASQLSDTSSMIMLENPYNLNGKVSLKLDNIRWVEKATKNIIYNPLTQEIQNIPSNMCLDDINDDSISLRVLEKTDHLYSFGADNVTISSTLDENDQYEVLIKIPFTSFSKTKDHLLSIENNYGENHPVNKIITELSLKP